jgi:hypothetical protein
MRQLERTLADMNRVTALLFCSFFLTAPILVTAQAPVAPKAAASAWDADLKRRHAELVERNGPGTDSVLRDELLKMKTTDQSAPERGLTQVAPEDMEKMRAAANEHTTDKALTEELKAIVAKSGWPTISLVGYEASNAAMLVLTHTRDHAWQLSLLPQLETLADQGKIDGSALATVIDKELVSEGKLQRYGSQFKVVDGEMAMFGVEDPSGLDARRAQVFLPPMPVYKQQLQDMFHMKASNKVVMASAPAK